ncbi:MAG: EamA/RhaT family transporter [Bacteroidota bacterium]|nr:EamA/RhaT family transporter [Bacteroidota bacterium]
MLSIIISLVCSVSVGILFKILKKHTVDFMQIIGWNYLITLSLTYFLFGINLQTIDFRNIPIITIGLLWILLPFIFLIQALSIKNVGIVRTDIAQRLSLFITLLASYFMFNENFSNLKILGFSVALMAIFFTLDKTQPSQNNQNLTSNAWIYPILVLFGFGIIDILFKQITIFHQNISFTTLLFIVFWGAFVFSWIYNIFRFVQQKTAFNISNFYWGIALGLLNFGNIYFYLKAHKELSDSPSTVFAMMNMGVITLGSLAGVFFFKESLSKKNYIGIAMALVAVCIILYTKLYS